MLDAYRDVLRSRLARRLLLLAAVSAPPREVYPIALVLFARQATGSYAAAGAALSASTVAAALTLPLRGWIVDRAGVHGGVRALAAVRTLGLLALLGASAAHAGTPAVVALAALTGATGAPPVAAALAANGLELALLRGTVGLQTMIDASATILGDVAVGAVAALASPTAVVLLVAALTVALGLAIQLAPDARASAHASSRWPRPPARGLRAIVWTALPFGALLGALDVAVPAFARAQGAVAAAGPIYAALALGMALGALVHGAVRAHAGLRRRYVRQWALAAVAFAPLLLARSIAAIVPLLVLGGLLLGPVMTLSIVLVRELAPGEAATEAMSWVAGGTMAGAAIGGALAGPIVDGLGVDAAIALAVACPAFGWLLARVLFARLPPARADAATAG
jgi:hypothetical protein